MTDSSAVNQMTGRQKAAVLLVALGPELSARVLTHCPESEVERLTLEVFNLKKVSDQTKQQVFTECHEMAIARRFIHLGGSDYARQMLENAVGKTKAAEIHSRLSAVLRPDPFDFVSKSEPGHIASLIEGEHPQTIALFLSHVDPQLAAATLAVMTPTLQLDIANRLATMDATPREVVEQIAEVLRAKLSMVVPADQNAAGGVGALVRVLNSADRTLEKTIIDGLEQSNPELASEVRKLTFTFDNLVQLDSRSLQRLLRDVESKDLAMALRGTGEDVRETFFRNLSSRAAEMLRDEMEVSGPVRMRAVQEAQQRIVSIARRLDESEEIVIQRGGSDVLV